MKEWMPDNPFPATRKCADEHGAIQEYVNPSHDTYNGACQQTARKIREWLRDKWAYDLAQGTPVFSIRLEDWEQFCKEVGL
jgi:hypothetical protein